MYNLTEKEQQAVHELVKKIAERMSDLSTLQAATRILEAKGEVELAEAIKKLTNPLHE